MAKLSPTWGKKWTSNMRNMPPTTKLFSLTRAIVPETSPSPFCQLANHTRLCGKRCNHCLGQGWKAGLPAMLPSLAGILEHPFPKRNHLAQLLSCHYVHVFLCATLRFSPTPHKYKGYSGLQIDMPQEEPLHHTAQVKDQNSRRNITSSKRKPAMKANPSEWHETSRQNP